MDEKSEARAKEQQLMAEAQLQEQQLMAEAQLQDLPSISHAQAHVISHAASYTMRYSTTHSASSHVIALAAILWQEFFHVVLFPQKHAVSHDWTLRNGNVWRASVQIPPSLENTSFQRLFFPRKRFLGGCSCTFSLSWNGSWVAVHIPSFLQMIVQQVSPFSIPCFPRKLYLSAVHIFVFPRYVCLAFFWASTQVSDLGKVPWFPDFPENVSWVEVQAASLPANVFWADVHVM